MFLSYLHLIIKNHLRQICFYSWKCLPFSLVLYLKSKNYLLWISFYSCKNNKVWYPPLLHTDIRCLSFFYFLFVEMSSFQYVLFTKYTFFPFLIFRNNKVWTYFSSSSYQPLFYVYVYVSNCQQKPLWMSLCYFRL